MSTEHNKNEERIYAEALSKPPEQRQVYIKQACGDDKELLDRVRALLKAREEAGSFLEVPAIDSNVTLDSSPSIEGPGTKIGHYELLELIGEGGMGLVYLAQQKEPVKRHVALKIIKPGMDSKQVIARFEAEKQALALLDHPNIAHVFDAGTTETGRPYFVMEYVRGTSINKYCDERKLNIEQRLRLFEQVCEGIHHAHQKGIIHRDIKPSNILISIHGDKAVPKIIDFGIAKAITQPLTDKTFVTFQGQLLGTPEYMSPEQVDLATQDIDTRSDIYALGVVLYELLAGVLPFERESLTHLGFAEVQRTIRELEPASPSIRLTSLGEKAKTIAASRSTQVVPLARRLHRELEWIPLKAMRKDRCRRYKSASDMADDIRNYLNGNPLIAGPETAIYRVKKFVHKHVGSVTTAALVAAAIILGLVISTAMYFRAEDALQKEAVARAQAEQAKDQETIARTRAEQTEQATKEKAEELRRLLYFNRIALADASYKVGNVGRTRELLKLCPDDLRGWEWHYLNHISDQAIMTVYGHKDCVNSVSVSPDGKYIVSGGDDNEIRIWNSTDGTEIMTLQGHEDLVRSVSFSFDNKFIASGSDDRTIKVWNAIDGRELITLRGHKEPVTCLAFSSNSKRIVSGSYDNTIKIWDAVSNADLMTLRGHKSFILSVSFSPDDKKIVSASWDGTIKIWNAVTGDEILSIQGHEGHLTCAAYSLDGRFIVSADHQYGTIKIWDASTGTEVRTLPGHDAWVRSVSISPDSKRIASAGDDNIIKIWDVKTGNELMNLRGHEGPVLSTAFSPDAKFIVSGGLDKTIKVWDVSIDHEVESLVGHQNNVLSIAFSPDGRRIVSGSADKTIKIWNVASGSEIMTLLGHRQQVPLRPYVPVVVAYSPNDKYIFSGAFDHTIKIWDAKTGTEIKTLRGHKGEINSLSLNPNGKLILSAGYDKLIKLWDVESGIEVMTLQGHKGEITSAEFSPDGKRIVSGSMDNTIKVWDVESGMETVTLDCGDRYANCVRFSPDNKWIASGFGDGMIEIWDAASGSRLISLHAHKDEVVSIAFSNDSQRLVSGSFDGTTKIWDATTGTELLTLQKSGANSIVFSPDGKTLATACDDDTIKLWKSTKPDDDYELRRKGAAARELVDSLYEDYGFYHDVVEKLQTDRKLEESVRKIALQIVNSRMWEDADKLSREGFEIVSLPDKNNEAYQSALKNAQKANQWESQNPRILTTLGMAQYRMEMYSDALKTLKKSKEVEAQKHLEPHPANTAFIAMALHHLSRYEEAKAALEQLQERYKQEELLAFLSWGWNIEIQDLLAEAEKLLLGEEPLHNKEP